MSKKNGMLSRVRVRSVGPQHYLIGGDDRVWGSMLPPPRLPPGGRRFWDRWLCDAVADAGVIATLDGNLIGFVRYGFDRKMIIGAGTWVAKAWRRKGIATRMWAVVLRRYPGRVIEIVGATTAGVRFIKSVIHPREA